MSLRSYDPEMFDLIRQEEKRQRHTINLIASENYASPATLKVQASILANKLGEGFIDRRECSGCEIIDKIEKLAVDRVKALFKAEHANVQAPTATQANLAVYSALLKPGDIVLAPKLSHGGHFSHGSQRHISGKIYRFFHYGVSRETEQIDIDAVEKMALENRPKLIIAGMSAYPRKIDFSKFKNIADKVGAYLLADIAHIAGLVITRLHPDPVPYADVVTSSTHKTLRGPRGGGIILCRREYAEAIDQAVFPGTQGAPLMNIVASRAVLFKEAMSPKFNVYQNQVVTNARVLAEAMASNGIRLVTGGTDIHMILIDLRPQGLEGKGAEDILYSAGIATNRNLIPFDEKSAGTTSGLRLGAAAVTTRGMKEEEMEEIGRIIAEVLLNPKDQPVLKGARKKVRSICRGFAIFSEEWES